MTEPDEDVVRAAALLLNYDEFGRCAFRPGCEGHPIGRIVLPDGVKLEGQSEVLACRECLNWARSHKQVKEIIGWVDWEEDDG